MGHLTRMGESRDRDVRGPGLDRSGSRSGEVVGSCECGNEPLRSIKCGEFLD